ncbi:CDP-diacylglycerol--glycerol-3-phosphate 3-phosphatidyltransferase [Desulfatitalea alkaliphila]|uniref:CDP-diacylglycerol--glycerol-3-phosphate 3-phosphatidyltransferase n=1 Tax=Desulfatitalea alkaliphila TaxID=2929485 RepID=A0AA41UKR2_9BACT|nr:CDP-diacylglycerol--glycerol-3-phosphate 3-phosphatidyltransferase [Desulfatitalea alkaliphila]MCJ8502574.1 CDP-diacylglycerol--glycerol-3-phosphate 3-phosphatidyltransferase [Desulfatitalea alkaliphila]
MRIPDRVQNRLKDPNTLTLFRVLAVPLVIMLLMVPNRFTCFLAAVIFSIAAITDYFDGFLARRHNMVSNLGKVMDPVADKLLVASTFIMLTALGWVPAWVVCVIVGRELAVSGLRNLMAEHREDVSASKLGKLKTGFQIAAAIPLIVHYPYLGIDIHVIGMFFLWGALIFTLWSGIDYFVRYRRLLHR